MSALPEFDLFDMLGDAVPPLDMPIPVTFFRDQRARDADAQTLTLRTLAERIRETRGPTKSGLPWLKLATFGDIPTPKGSLRHDANLSTISGVEGDYDAGVLSPAEAAERLRAAGVAAIVYTTPSHTPDAPRWRALAPTSKPLSPDERETLCARLNGALGGVLAPESFTRSQAYYYGAIGEGPGHTVHEVAGRFIDAATDVKPIGRRSEAPASDDVDDLAALLEPDWERIEPALAVIPADDRDIWLQVGMALHKESRGSTRGFETWEAWSRRSDKFNAKDQRRTWDSFGGERSASVALGTIFHLARQFEPKPSGRLTLLTPDQCEGYRSRGYLLKGLVAPGDVGCIFGAPGAGKSLIGPHIGYAIAQGREAFGMRARQGGVFYVAAEDPHGMQSRVSALRRTHGEAPDFRLVAGVSDLLSDTSPDLAALREAVETHRPALIIVDTLAMAFPGLEENSAEAMGRVVAVARGLAESGAAVILVHHDTKAEGATPRGHSLLNGALDFALHVKKDEFGAVRATLTKNRNGTCDRAIAFLPIPQ